MAPPPVPFFHPRKNPAKTPPQGGAGLSKVMIVPAITRKTNEIPRNPPRPNGIRPRPHTIKFKKISIFG